MTDDEVVIGADGRRLRPVKAVARAVDLLDVVAAADSPIGVTELALAAQCSKTAAYNIVTTLELRGLVRRDTDNRYMLGWRLLELGEIVRVSSNFGDAARARLHSLAELVGETAVLAVLDVTTVIFVEVVESRRSLPTMTMSPGRRTPIDASAAGHVLLAFASESRRRRLLQEFAPAGAKTLESSLRGVRRLGVAVGAGGVDPDQVGIAAPVFDYTGDAVASVSLLGPETRLPRSRIDETILEVQRCATDISTGLGSDRTERLVTGGP